MQGQVGCHGDSIQINVNGSQIWLRRGIIADVLIVGIEVCPFDDTRVCEDEIQTMAFSEDSLEYRR